MNWQRAFLGGVIGGAVMTVLLALARAMGMPANISMLLGTMVGLMPGPGAWVVGFIIHLVLSGVVAFLYGWGFEQLTHRAGSWVGAGFSVIHFILAGLFLGLIPALHPAIPTQMSAPGIFMSNLGAAGVVAFIVLHVIYGLIVGTTYGPVHHARPERQPREAPAGAHQS